MKIVKTDLLDLVGISHNLEIKKRVILNKSDGLPQLMMFGRAIFQSGQKVEMHSQENPFNKSVEWVYFGLATD